jgi:hypothetical protein
MKKIGCFIICSTLVLISRVYAQADPVSLHNITAIAMVFSLNDSIIATNTGTPIIVRYKNNGSIDEPITVVTAVIRNPQGASVYRDTETVKNWQAGDTLDITFRNFTPTQSGIYGICGIANLVADEQRSDDTICSVVHSVGVDPDNTVDIKAVDIIDPALGAKKTEKEVFQPKAVFQFVSGKTDFHNVTAHLSIVRTSDGVSLFEIDSLIPLIPKDSTPIEFSFPNRWRDNAISDIAPDWYRMTVFVNLSTDRDHSNDTAISVFQIVPVESVAEDIPSAAGIGLSQNHPNPFTGKTEIGLTLRHDGFVTLRVVDKTGREIRIILKGERMSAGEHSIDIASTGLPSGMYVYELTFTDWSGSSVREMRTMCVLH